jgi:alkylhydroperoxidase family enzyme
VLGERPDLYEPYRGFADLFHERRLVDPTVLDLCRARTMELLGWEAAGLAGWPTDPGFTDAQRAALAFAERFVIDPHGVPGPIREELDRHYTLPEIVALSEWMAINDGFTRFRLLLCDAPDGVPTPGSHVETLELPDDADPTITQSILGEQPETLLAFLRLYGTLWSHGEVDHTVKEIARLRNARITDCGY